MVTQRMSAWISFLQHDFYRKPRGHFSEILLRRLRTTTESNSVCVGPRARRVFPPPGGGRTRGSIFRPITKNRFCRAGGGGVPGTTVACGASPPPDPAKMIFSCRALKIMPDLPPPSRGRRSVEPVSARRVSATPGMSARAAVAPRSAAVVVRSSPKPAVVRPILGARSDCERRPIAAVVVADVLRPNRIPCGSVSPSVLRPRGGGETSRPMLHGTNQQRATRVALRGYQDDLIADVSRLKTHAPGSASAATPRSGRPGGCGRAPG